MIARLAARCRDERGFTIAEVTISMILIVIVGASIGSTLTGQFQATSALERRSEGVDELRVGTSRLEREFRSAECVHEPDVTTPGGSASGSRLRFETRLNTGSYEVLYRVENGTLYRTRGGYDEVLAANLVDAEQTFTISDSARRRLDVVLSMQPDGKELNVLETSVAGRNAWRDC